MMQRAAQLLAMVCCLACCSCRQPASGGPPGGLPGQPQNTQSARSGEAPDALDSPADSGDGREQNPDLSPGEGPPAVVKEDGIENELTASAILLQSQSAYDELKSYWGTIDVTSALTAGQAPQRAEAQVVFKRPEFMRIDGKTTPVLPWDPTSQSDFIILSDGAAVWDWDELMQKTKVLSRSPGILDSLEKFAGVTQGASRTLPSILLKARTHPYLSDRLLAAMAVGAVLEGQESIDGAPCYRVSNQHVSGTYTFWVDRESFLLRKHQVERDAKQIRRFTGARFSRLYSTNTIEHYTIESINVELDDELFKPEE